MVKRGKFSLEWLLILAGSIVLIGGTLFKVLPLDITEVLGFVTGAISVWLTVKQNIWNWPIGIVNNGFYVVLFFTSHLYADMTLQLVYIVLGLLGWYWWLKGGENKTELPIGYCSFTTVLVLGLLTAISTILLTIFLQSVDDAAPFLDAFTTVISLVAQYMLTRKLLENWHVWISADIIYIGLYVYKNLYLTSLLYVIFMIMCVIGLWQWRKSIKVISKVESPILLGPTHALFSKEFDTTNSSEKESMVVNGKI